MYRYPNEKCLVHEYASTKILRFNARDAATSQLEYSYRSTSFEVVKRSTRILPMAAEIAVFVDSSTVRSARESGATIWNEIYGKIYFLSLPLSRYLHKIFRVYAKSMRGTLSSKRQLRTRAWTITIKETIAYLDDVH